MSDLTEFLRARLAEDEQAAKQATEHASPSWWVEDGERLNYWINRSEASAVAPTLRPELVPHIARHDPARVLAEVEGKRRIIADLLAEPHFLNDSEWYGCRAVAEGPGEDDVPTGRECTCGRDARLELYLRLFALPFADHADYREGWKP